MRSLAFVMALSLGLGAAHAEEKAVPAAKKQQKKAIQIDAVDVTGKREVPVGIVLPRSEKARADVDSASDHLQDAAERR